MRRLAPLVLACALAAVAGSRLYAQSAPAGHDAHAGSDHVAAMADDPASYLNVNVAVSDTDLQPASIFVPAGRQVQLTLRNRGTREHHYHVVGLAPEELAWIQRGEPKPAELCGPADAPLEQGLPAGFGLLESTAPLPGPADEDEDEHSSHHDRHLTRVRAESPMGVRPNGREIHAYVSVPGEIDIVLFKTTQVGRYAVRCDLHDEILGTFTVFDAADAMAGAQPAMPPGQLLARALTRDFGAVDYPGSAGVQVEATYATPEFVTQALGGATAAATLQADQHIAFLVTERTHSTNLPARPVAPALFVDGRPVAPVDAKVMTDSVHHRATFYRFTREAGFGTGHQTVTLRLAAGREATWHLPLILPAATTAGGPIGLGEQWGLILALLGGMVAAMWPCLFQLTVYFIPALAGVAMQDSGDTEAGRRRQVLIAAFYFILGFTLVYTATGALIGFAAQRLGEQQQFESWQRYFSIGAGIVVIGLALRTAAKARAPLVCRMPLLSGMTRSNKPATRIEMMLAGLAFATGCMTCFGSALVVGMVVYVGLAQSPVYGALVLFLFSLGMGIPLVAAALAMARALPLLMKLETAVPWMGLASAILMGGFGVLLISGHYMLVSEWTFRVVNGTMALPTGALNAAAAALITTAAAAAWLVWKQRSSPRVSTKSA